jgi:RNA polymerase sigma factor (sigma-70 family)
VEASALRAPSAPGRILGPGPLLRLRADDQLIALFRKGHDEAFEVIFARYGARLLDYTRRMLGGSRSDAEDAMQEVFLSAYSALRRDDRPITLRAWLYRIAHNRCIDQIRRPAPAPADVLDVSRTPLRDPVVEAERNEKLRQLLTDIGRLPEQQRSAALMRWFDGLPYGEIAAALGVSVKAVKSLLVRARVSVAEADEARNAACADIRSDVAAAFDRGVRTTGRSCKHLRDCAPCRDYKARLRDLDRALGGAAPRHGAFAAIAKLLGIGGASSGVAVGAGTVAVGGPVAAKITALVCCGVAAAGVARLDTPPRPAPVSPPAHATRTAAPTTATPTAAVLARVDRRVPAAAAAVRLHRAAYAQPAARPRPTALGDLREGALSVHRAVAAPAPKPMTPHDAARSTGGTMAPDDLAPRTEEPPLRETTVGPAAASDAPAIAPPDTPATYGPAPEAPATAAAPETSAQPAAAARPEAPAPAAGASARPPPAP